MFARSFSLGAELGFDGLRFWVSGVKKMEGREDRGKHKEPLSRCLSESVKRLPQLPNRIGSMSLKHRGGFM